MKDKMRKWWASIWFIAGENFAAGAGTYVNETKDSFINRLLGRQ